MLKLEEEIMSAGMLKIHLHGLGRDVAFHHFTKCEDIFYHNHPFDFTSFIIKGGYVEEIMFFSELTDKWHRHSETHLPGQSFRIEANHIHKITELLDGDCVTATLPEKKVQEPGFFRFDKGNAEHRFWNEENFKPYTFLKK